MKKVIIHALTISALLCCSSFVVASEQATVTARDMTWMKQQQKSLQEFQETMRGQTLQLPAGQQDLVSRLQQNIAEGQAQQGGSEKKAFTAIYFVSLGIPREGLLPMLQDASRFGIPATIRGLVNNDMRQTASVMFELTKEDKNIGVQIDPTLYSDYGIKAVPALVVTCPGHFDVIRGSLSIRQALEKIAERGDCAQTAKTLLGGKS